MKYRVTWKLKAIMGAVFVIDLIATVWAANYDIRAFQIAVITIPLIMMVNVMLWFPHPPSRKDQ